ncbi:MAG: ribulose 1,5-bisphosphate carboxylase [Gemmatimonadales bacterium]|nr:ribulose 1,5-bisphosphate carboxylase [Gemmatimonadales bacterium]NIN13037.1 ribulose 1,5-bisphosphate carboxylase [Gemmatimonadales bacterium]NIN51121.1 ribulose 1,5-bisphosphate carboxylase [Gemmatimonadales bacterium]NIP08585.1 ribulose 1,5-bisphosphate carboxylase [Gemmatimonadales bacterium]NIQ99695.1 ribulose 1,5-bisphosphate carboxylase [Gemmatimonadales bacterium]
MEQSPDERIRITYLLTLAEGEMPEARARAVALEQTVELPDGCYPRRIEEQVVGRLEALEQRGPGRWQAILSFAAALAGDGVPQLLNLVFGNVSFQRGVLVTGLELPSGVLRRFPGPRYGIAGIRAGCGGIRGRPLLCSAAKPQGLSPVELAELCGALAKGGIDIVKDDHGVTDQAAAPFRERVERCQGAVLEANAATGGSTLYFPHVTAPLGGLEERVTIARAAGCRGVLISPFLVGLDTIRWLAESTELMVLVHPTFSGTLLRGDHGIAPAVLFGRLVRPLGADAVIYVSAGGRFPISEQDCEAINTSLREPLDHVRPAFPVAGGGVDVERVPHWIDRYGVDTMFLVGSSLYAQADLETASRRLVEAVREHCDV